jgi:hypothetical protein
MLKVEIAVSNEFNHFIIKSRQDFSQQAVRRLALWAERNQKIVSLHPLRSCILSILFHS